MSQIAQRYLRYYRHRVYSQHGTNGRSALNEDSRWRAVRQTSRMFGPEVSPYEDADHVFWLLSSASLWLPTLVRTTLLSGMKNRPTWMWHEGEFAEVLFFAKKIQKVKWTRAVIDDVRSRIHKTVSLLGLSDSEDQLLERFKEERFAESYLKFEEERTKAQTRKRTSKE
jgi:hypothetical protein